jgi:Raf kinase inhibitor-like YbhB/YbcL family protein
MKLSSPAFENGGKIPARHTCNGDNINPPLKISDVPPAAKSLALIMEDPDVPKKLRADGMWDHWIVFNIPADADEIREGHEPEGIHGQGTGGNLEYFGPCPPDREHRYFFRLFALDTKLDLKEGSKKTEVQKAMEGHVLETADLMGLYEQPK